VIRVGPADFDPIGLQARAAELTAGVRGRLVAGGRDDTQ
jgi:hypothetical protein